MGKHLVNIMLTVKNFVSDKSSGWQVSWKYMWMVVSILQKHLIKKLDGTEVQWILTKNIQKYNVP